MNKTKVKSKKVKVKNCPIVNFSFFAAFWLCVSAVFFPAHAQTGGTYDLSHSVIASGGGSNSTGGTFRVDGTIGQTAAGTSSTGSTFDLRGGFWAFQTYTPTAATTSVSGRVLTFGRIGIRNARVTLTGANGEARSVLSSAFGYFKFDEITSGATYIISVSARRFQFGQPAQAVSVVEEITGLEFVANP